MHGAHNTCRNAYRTLRKKCTFTHACAPVQRCRNFFAMEAIAYLESCASIVQAIVCRLPCCCLVEISRPMLFAQEIRPNPRQLMTRSPLRFRTSIFRSSALAQAWASSSLSMVRTRRVATELTHHRNLFPPFFSRASCCCRPQSRRAVTTSTLVRPRCVLLAAHTRSRGQKASGARW